MKEFFQEVQKIFMLALVFALCFNAALLLGGAAWPLMALVFLAFYGVLMMPNSK